MPWADGRFISNLDRAVFIYAARTYRQSTT